MQELIIAILGAAGIIIAARVLDKRNIDKHQTELEKKVLDNEKDVARLEGQQEQEDKTTKEKVDEIEREKSNKLSGSLLADFFQRRK